MAGSRRVARGWGSSRVVGVAVMGLLVAGGVVGVVAGSAPRASVGGFLDGTAMLSDGVNGAVVQVDGASARPVAKVSLRGAAGARMRVVQRGGSAYVSVTSRDGSVRLFRVAESDLSGGSRGIGSGQVLVRGGSRAYLVDRGSGRVQAIDAKSLRRRGPALSFGGPVDAVAGGDGVLVVARRGSGRVIPVVGSSRGRALRVGDRGGRLLLSVVGGKPVVWDEAAGVLRVVEGRRLGLRVRVAPRLGRFVVPEVVETPEWVALDRSGGRGVLVRVDLADGRVARVPVRGDVSGLGAPMVTPGAVFLADADAGLVLVVDPGSGAARRVRPDVGAPGRVEVFVQSGVLFVNDPNGRGAAVVDADGRVRTLDKYEPEIPDLGDPPPTPPVTLPPPPAPPAPAPESGPPPPVVSPPGPPKDLAATAGNRRVDLSWTPADDGGGTIDHYTIRCSPDCGNGADSVQIPGNVAAFAVERLRNGREYTFSLKATNEVGTGPASARVQAEPTGDVPGVPTRVAARANPDGTVTVTWRAPEDEGQGITGYRIQPHHGSDTLDSYPPTAPRVTTFTTPAGAFSEYYDSADPQVSFTVKATGTGKDGAEVSSAESTPSAPVKPYEPPGAPVAVTGRAGDGKVTVTFGAAPPNGRPIERYEILNAGAVAWNGPGPASNVAVNVANGARPDLKVRACNEAGCGATATVPTDTPYPTPTVTGRVSRVGSRNAELGVSVDWKGAPPGTCRASAGSWSADCSTLTLSGLGHGSGFSVNVNATNLNGDSGATTVSGTTTSPSISIRWGGSARGQATGAPGVACDSSCLWIDGDFRNFAWNSSISVTCWSNEPNQPGDWKTYTVSTDGNGNADVRNSGCFFGYYNYVVELKADGIGSGQLNRGPVP